MPLTRVEQALDMMRLYLVECAAQNDWGEHRSEELAQTIVACIRQTTDQAGQKPPERDLRLERDVLRRAIRFDPFTFGRGFKLATGMTPHQYIIRCRLRRAMRLLAQRADARRYRARG